ncbi:MAG: 3-hydroxyacyl-CoA dehydrogenase family protein [Cyanobacteria bacterium REEB67]|nr:3-hydroxyacyl-CoA dehydrogenase family protein [Cyanobacteria bacterium REEB67]
MQISQVAVVGAGTMGASITVALVGAGLKVLLKETEQSFLDRGLANVDRFLAGKVKKGLLSESEAAAQRTLIEPVLDFSRFAEADFVIEAAPEALNIKREIFEQLDQWCNVDAILATNTSSLSISQIANFTRRADKVVGMHFFNPAHIMKLVEVIPGLETSHDTVKTTLELGASLGKLSVRVEECASFLVNRLLGRYMNESLYTLQDGRASVDEIDKAAQDFAMPIGPLALRDMNGADIGLAVANFNYLEYGERFAVPAVLPLMVAQNLLGAKTQAGFYTYDTETRKRQGVNPALTPLLASIKADSDATGKKSAKDIAVLPAFDGAQLFLPMINEAFLVMQERICQPEDLDPALMAGLGMRRGPLAMAAEIGLKDCLTLLENRFAAGEERFRPAPLLKRFVFAGRTSVI